MMKRIWGNILHGRYTHTAHARGGGGGGDEICARLQHDAAVTHANSVHTHIMSS